MVKASLSIKEQIAHMKNKGICFCHVSEDDAEIFLKQNNYYFRIKSYAKNYEKYLHPPKQGKYINLDFAYLKELSILDMHLRRILLRMTLDIEHSLKVNFINDALNSDHENGYDIVNDFLIHDKHGIKLKNKLNEMHTSYANKPLQTHTYTSNLIKKYYPDFAIWNLIEVLTFGEFIQFYNYYYKLKSKNPAFKEYTWSTKIIRNATAHNNCILNNLTAKMQNKMSNTVRLFLKNNASTKAYYSKYKHNFLIMDIISVCHLYSQIRHNNEEKNEFFNEIQEKVLNRFFKTGYFSKNQTLSDVFRLLDNVIKILNKDLII